MDNIKLYKNISLDIIVLLKNKNIDKLDELLDKREDILDKEVNNSSFKQLLINNGILDLDKEIHKLLSESMDSIKEEILSHKRLNLANNSYINFSKQNLNIFNKKV